MRRFFFRREEYPRSEETTYRLYASDRPDDALARITWAPTNHPSMGRSALSTYIRVAAADGEMNTVSLHVEWLRRMLFIRTWSPLAAKIIRDALPALSSAFSAPRDITYCFSWWLAWKGARGIPHFFIKSDLGVPDGEWAERWPKWRCFSLDSESKLWEYLPKESIDHGVLAFQFDDELVRWHLIEDRFIHAFKLAPKIRHIDKSFTFTALTPKDAVLLGRGDQATRIHQYHAHQDTVTRAVADFAENVYLTREANGW